MKTSFTLSRANDYDRIVELLILSEYRNGGKNYETLQESNTRDGHSQHHINQKH